MTSFKHPLATSILVGSDTRLPFHRESVRISKSAHQRILSKDVPLCFNTKHMEITHNNVNQLSGQMVKYSSQLKTRTASGQSYPSIAGRGFWQLSPSSPIQHDGWATSAAVTFISGTDRGDCVKEETRAVLLCWGLTFFLIRREDLNHRCLTRRLWDFLPAINKTIGAENCSGFFFNHTTQGSLFTER